MFSQSSKYCVFIRWVPAIRKPLPGPAYLAAQLFNTAIANFINISNASLYFKTYLYFSVPQQALQNNALTKRRNTTN